MQVKVSGSLPCCCSRSSRAALPSSPSRSTTKDFDCGPCTIPTEAFGHRLYHWLIVLKPLLAALVPWVQRGCLPRFFSGHSGVQPVPGHIGTIKKPKSASPSAALTGSLLLI